MVPLSKGYSCSRIVSTSVEYPRLYSAGGFSGLPIPAMVQERDEPGANRAAEAICQLCKSAQLERRLTWSISGNTSGSMPQGCLSYSRNRQKVRF